ncbi:MAG TPA: sigma-54-dependent Fis family transcriptional regulator, partial [Syntrophomonas sp.]|nr:sigma-54-dependent Fis family transcriptional regulator [Syntrophomonas sp.]
MADIKQVWERFIKTGRLEPNEVRAPILASWVRCFRAGVDPYDGASHQRLNDNEMEELLTQRQDLIDIARHAMDNLYQFVAGSGFIVILSDERGYIMEIMGDADTMEMAAEINLCRGYSWVEKEGGTNGVGTALALGKPIQVSGAEHYCERVQGWTCSAAPIFNESGSIIAVLQMSGPSRAAHTHTLGMVVAAAEAVNEQMMVRKQNRELMVLNNNMNKIFQTISDGAVIIDDKGFVRQINPAAEKMFGSKIDNIQDIISTFRDILKSLSEGGKYSDVEMMLDTAQGRVHCLVSCMPINDEPGQLSGAVVFFNPINRVKKLINRFSGAQATFHFEDIKGSSEKLLEAIRVAHSAASSVSHVLIEGESGTGKELFAQAIHNESLRSQGPFVAMNCAAIPRELIASELFGYVEGAFTGARRGGRTGKFELASGGTLFLDEIGDMPMEQQAALLRVLQEKEIVRVGSDMVISVDVRVICATNKNLWEEVNAGNFRNDLYYRLNVIQVTVPPLRERKEDIPLLFEYFLHKTGMRANKRIDRVDPEVIDYLKQYDWPGNIRELENVVEKTINAIEGNIIHLINLPTLVNTIEAKPGAAALKTLPPAESDGDFGSNLKKVLAERERQEIITLLLKHEGNVTRVAKEMNV